MRKYFEVFRFNLKSEMNFKIDYFFSLLSFAVHIFVFNALWDFILQDKAILGYTKAELIWYIIVGEFVAYSVGKKNYLKVSEMIKSGDIANLLTKPISIMKYIVAQEGTCVINILVNFLFGIVMGIVMAGSIAIEPVQIFLFVLSLALGLTIDIFLQVFIGLLAFITEENQSFYLVISKAILLLIFTPLEFFPQAVQNILRFLPTTYIVYPPGKILVDFNLQNAILLIGAQIISLIGVFACAYALNKKGVRNINVNGG